MEKKVLVLCTGNSCRSIIAEALINSELEDISAWSSGVAPGGRVNENAKKVLKAHGIWDDRYHSKKLDEVQDIDFALVVTVCDHAKETCPVFPGDVKVLHIGFEDPDGKPYEAFEETYEAIRKRLLPEISRNLEENSMKKDVTKTQSGVKINFAGVVQKQQIVKMVENCATGQCECMSDETKKKISDMKVDGRDGEVTLELTGDVAKEEIEAALKKSKVLNK